MKKNQKEGKSSFLHDFYVVSKKDEKTEKKSPGKKLNFAEFYRQRRFTLWFWLSFIAAIVASALLLSSGITWGIIVFFILFLMAHVGVYCEKVNTCDTCYGNTTIWFIWAFATWAIYCFCGFLFAKEDVIDQHLLGLIIGTISGIVFTFFLPVINYALGLNVKSSGYSQREADDDLKPSKNDQKACYKLLIAVAMILSLSTFTLISIERSDLKEYQQKIAFEKQPLSDILSKEFVVRDKWYDKEVFALVETSQGIFAVEAKYYPDVCSATKVRVLPDKKEKEINGRNYQTFALIEFETPASD